MQGVRTVSKKTLSLLLALALVLSGIMAVGLTKNEPAFAANNQMSSSDMKTWIKNYGGSDSDYFEQVIQTSDGAFVAAGFSKSNDGDLISNDGSWDFVIAKFDSNGNKAWVKNYGGSEIDELNSVIQTNDGGFVAVGESDSNDGDFTNNKGSSDFIIAKFDSNGNKTWIKNYGGSKYDVFFSVFQTSDGGFVAVGNSNSSDGDLSEKKGDSDFIIAKFDSNGDKIWIKNYGGSNYDELNSVIQTSDGDFVAVGYSESDNDDIADNNGRYDFIIAKFDSSGDKTWIKNYGGSDWDIFNSVIQTSDGGLVAVGYSESDDYDIAGNNGGSDFIIAKFDSNGNKTWIKNYGGDKYEAFDSVIKTSDGGFIAVGGSTSNNGDLASNNGSDDFIIAKFDSDGDKIWIKNYGGNGGDGFRSVIQASDGGLVAVGYSNSNDADLVGNIDNSDFIIAKFDSNGNYAHWSPDNKATETCTVTFNSNGGGAVAARSVEHGKAIGALPTPKRDNYSFLGWHTALTGGTLVTASTIPTNNMTVHAHWKPNKPASSAPSTIVNHVDFKTHVKFTASAKKSIKKKKSTTIKLTAFKNVTVKSIALDKSGKKLKLKVTKAKNSIKVKAGSKKGKGKITVTLKNGNKKTITVTIK